MFFLAAALLSCALALVYTSAIAVEETFGIQTPKPRGGSLEYSFPLTPPSLIPDPMQNLFRDPPTVLGNTVEKDTRIFPYLGIGFGNGVTGDVNQQILQQRYLQGLSSSSFSGLHNGLIPNEVQLGIRLPF